VALVEHVTVASFAHITLLTNQVLQSVPGMFAALKTAHLGG